MQTKKMSKSILVLLTLLTSLNSYAKEYKFSCDNEKEETTAGEVYYEVKGNINPEDSTLVNVTLEKMEVKRGGDVLLGQTKANTLSPESSDQNTIIYSFNGDISGQTQKVKITFLRDAVGLKYLISVDDNRLSWCTPLHQ